MIKWKEDLKSHGLKVIQELRKWTYRIFDDDDVDDDDVILAMIE